MKTNIKFSDYRALQRSLDEAFGVNTFQVTVDKSQEFRQIFLENADDVDSTTVDSAVNLANQLGDQCLEKNKKLIYKRVDRASDKTIQRCSIKIITEEQKVEITDWLSDQSKPCPEVVMDHSVLTNVTTVMAAQNLLNDLQSYNNLVNQVKSIRLSAKAKIIAVSDYIELKKEITSAMNQLNSLEQQYLK